MKAKLIIDGKEFDIEIFSKEMEKLIKPTNKTGYKRADEEECCFCGDGVSRAYVTDSLRGEKI